MKLNDVLFENWTNWSKGGITGEEIESKFDKQTLEFLLKWIDNGFNHEGEIRPILTLKEVVDIATWCLYGAHTLPYLPRELMVARVEEVARGFRINSSVLNHLIIDCPKLEEQH